MMAAGGKGISPWSKPSPSSLARVRMVDLVEGEEVRIEVGRLCKGDIWQEPVPVMQLVTHSGGDHCMQLSINFVS